MEHPFFINGPPPNRPEALRWLSIAEKLLTNRDLVGSKSFANRARESDPTLAPAADQILGIVDTLIAGDKQQRFPFSEQAWRLVVDAFSVLSNPLRKSKFKCRPNVCEYAVQDPRSHAAGDEQPATFLSLNQPQPVTSVRSLNRENPPFGIRLNSTQVENRWFLPQHGNQQPPGISAEQHGNKQPLGDFCRAAWEPTASGDFCRAP
ncbi:hypothetical protein HAX54_025330 [Datura stramonium]|uniref:Uncharacterized protein n=1 Tax=Datura stramonium TaxID=4076 RepID=A0ABS8V255_DATST|nr:hypothetical protein [Datura stramonium]